MSRLEIHVGGSLEDMKRRVVDAVERAKHGEIIGEEHVNFESWEALASVFANTSKPLHRPG